MGREGKSSKSRSVLVRNSAVGERALVTSSSRRSLEDVPKFCGTKSI